MKINKNLLIMTSIDDLPFIKKELNKYFNITYIKNPSHKKIKDIVNSFFAIFTNPNNTRVFLGKEILEKAKNLKVICTASTGTNHIDLNVAKSKKIKIICLKEERSIINKISSTAELALGLTINSLRNINLSYLSVLNNKWDYTPYIGRQMNSLKIGVVGYGRLGKFYCKYISSFGSKIFVYDPFKKIKNSKYHQINNLSKFLSICDIISIHIHYNKNNNKIINSEWFRKMKPNVIIVNTSRGELINEKDLINFIKKNKNSKYAADVVNNESNYTHNDLIKFSKKNNQIILTPHLGGMTKEAREYAYGHASKKLIEYYKLTN